MHFSHTQIQYTLNSCKHYYFTCKLNANLKGMQRLTQSDSWLVTKFPVLKQMFYNMYI
jgi:hypothetical protein